MIVTADVEKLKCIYYGTIKSEVDVEWFGLNCNSNLDSVSDYAKLLVDLTNISPTVCRSLECKILEFNENKSSYCVNCESPCVRSTVSTGATITCPANISATTNNSNGATITYTTPTFTTSCNGGGTLTRIAGLASGSTFPGGTTTVTYQLTDACGTSITCSFTVTVIVNQP